MDTKSIVKMPGYHYSEYLLVVSPHEELLNKIKKIKEEFSEKYKLEQAKWGKAHLALVNFVQFEMLEERIINRLKIITMGYPPFKVDLKDFGSFPSHTIYVNVDSKQQVHNLVKELRPVQQLLKLNKDHKPHFFDDPYITIAAKLLPWQYEQGWKEFSHRNFTGGFVADSMLLLKRRLGDKAYQVARRFEFMNLPVITKQGELFI